ncbi:sodium/calcium exchanger protein domain-containing protein [Ditylenchus destructor]|uniref:Sodium/calcium exchanger protein domain-containing protein n=1 Tax=Ditylenchus destructor TaxID=166010 RepID=A0AAD4NEM0_9BILA|nr:sodium/calcium exchanger protein domain-containing protein [Ditylenchus destructor]
MRGYIWIFLLSIIFPCEIKSGEVLTVYSTSRGVSFTPVDNVSDTQQEHRCAPPKSCKPGVILPVWEPEDVPTSTRIFRAFVYFLAMAYLFYGVSIVADRFMSAIEVITSQEREVQITKVTGETTTVLVRVWNETVSNLTLMALGSSAPEILLSVIEIFGNNFEAGDLGPSTIVGSAAFNLFVIIAVCIGVVPSNEIRKVHRIDVFWVTVAWSTFAYIWLFLILSVFSPNIIEVWEGVLTFLFFPLTVASAFMANKHAPAFGQRLLGVGNISSLVRRSPPRMGAPRKAGSKTLLKEPKNGSQRNGKYDAEVALMGAGRKNSNASIFDDQRRHYFDIFRKLRAENPDLSIPELERLATAYVFAEAPKSRAFYRIQATHKMMGAGDLISKKLRRQVSEDASLLPLMPSKPKQVVVRFDPTNYMCLENVGTIAVSVSVDRGSLQVATRVIVHYKTVPDTAQEHEDFIPTEGLLTFQPHESRKTIEIGIVDNDVYEDDEQFFVKLFDVQACCDENETQQLAATIDSKADTATVLIIDDDHGGIVTVPYKTIDGAAKEGLDYIGHDGELRFEDGQVKAGIEIEIINDDEYEKAEDFYVELGEPIWHVKKTSDQSGPDGRPIVGAHKRCRVTITEDKEFKNFVDKMLVNANTSFMYIALPWKIFGAIIPPTDYFNGWATFVVAIIGIGILTAFIGDVAALFGCTIGLRDSVTAITLVAMGTSLPDTFASKTAAVQDKTADASIGNVTGSNAVNVFLGIGVAWAIAAVYHAWNGRYFMVDRGSLASSVTLFLLGSVICFAVMQWRRYHPDVAGELGGPAKYKAISIAIFIAVWAIYLIYSSLIAYCILPGF